MSNCTATRDDKATRVVTGKNTRFSYCNVREPRSMNGGTPRYGTSLLIPKTDRVTVKALHDAVKAAYEKGKDKLKNRNGTVPPMEAIKLPIRDGDTERPDDPAYAGCLFVNASSDTAPRLYDADAVELPDRSEIYSGCYGKASINFYAFNTNGNRGIACGLNGLQKLRDGEPLGGRGDVRADFIAAKDDDEGEDFLS